LTITSSGQELLIDIYFRLFFKGMSNLEEMDKIHPESSLAASACTGKVLPKKSAWRFSMCSLNEALM
jgi:hypothetical protein